MAKGESSSSSRAARGQRAAAGYWVIARRPLQILAFLLPLIVAYELCLALLLRSESGVLTNKAHETVLEFFHVFGIDAAGGLYLGGLVILAVLFTWHVLNRDPWTIDVRGLGMMAAESVALTAPLLMLAVALARSAPQPMMALAGAPGGGAELAALDPGARLAISIGAGLYEELLFRMLLIAVVHTLLVDVLGASTTIGGVIAVLVSAVAFTLYHPTGDAGGVDWTRVVFYLAAGLYFGAIYILRGFGIVVAVHALYDVVTVLVLMPAE